jgi:hypothetical protein
LILVTLGHSCWNLNLSSRLQPPTSYLQHFSTLNLNLNLPNRLQPQTSHLQLSAPFSLQSSAFSLDPFPSTSASTSTYLPH